MKVPCREAGQGQGVQTHVSSKQTNKNDVKKRSAKTAKKNHMRVLVPRNGSDEQGGRKEGVGLQEVWKKTVCMSILQK
jgi:hypothetical protein